MDTDARTRFSLSFPTELVDVLDRRARLELRSRGAEIEVLVRRALAEPNKTAGGRDTSLAPPEVSGQGGSTGRRAIPSSGSASASEPEESEAAPSPSPLPPPSTGAGTPAAGSAGASPRPALTEPRSAAPAWLPTNDDLSRPRERVTRSAAELAASLGTSLAKDVPAKSFSKADQAGRSEQGKGKRL